MPLTQLDPIPALIVIDLQKGIVSIPGADPMNEIIDRSAKLANAFRRRNLPVILVNVNPSGATPAGRTDFVRPKMSLPPDWADLIPELEVKPTDHLVTKHRPGAFINTDLDAYLRSRNATQVFITGVATTVGVESTARSAYDHGYNVVLVTDAMTDRSPDAHRHAIDLTFPKFAELCTTAEALQSLSA
jgi:nicotinamidase-related amidase